MIKKILYVVCICMLMCIIGTGCGKETLTVSEAEQFVADGGDVSGVDGSEDTDKTDRSDSGSAETEEADVDMITVFACGAVASEGVYELPVGSRVNDALSAAGGFAEGADTSYVNLADTLTDGDKIYFPMEDEESNSSSGSSSSDGSGTVLVNINTADTLTLTSLPGIGETRAKRIVAYRDSHGDFATCDELKNVSGIGDSIYDSLKDYITVE